MPKICYHNNVYRKSGQSAMEYLLLLGVMVVIALSAFHNNTMLSEVFIRTNGHFVNASAAIVGNIANPSVGGPFP